jgi:hypothetical protein
MVGLKKSPRGLGVAGDVVSGGLGVAGDVVSGGLGVAGDVVSGAGNVVSAGFESAQAMAQEAGLTDLDDDEEDLDAEN